MIKKKKLEQHKKQIFLVIEHFLVAKALGNQVEVALQTGLKLN